MSSVALIEKPNAETKLIIMYREHKVLLDHLAPGEKKRVICAAAKLIPYFSRWKDWKKKFYPSEWVYQPLTNIQKDLLEEHSIHVVRSALALLERLGFLSKRKNDRSTNNRNGQDRTYQYLIHGDRIEEALENLFSPSEPETPTTTSFVNVESPRINIESPRIDVESPNFTDERYTQIPSKIPAKIPALSQEKERERINDFLSQEKEEEIDQEEDVVPTPLPSQPTTKGVLPQNKDLRSDKSSAPTHVKKLQNDLLTPEGWDEFYPQLLEYARREGKSSPAAWTATTARDILTEVAAGRPHCLWNDFQEGLLLGTNEFGGQREWLNPETQEPWPYFKEALTDHFQRKDAPQTKEVKSRFDVAGEVAAALAQPKKAATYWAELKREIIFYRERWERDRQLGISQPYLPPHLSDRSEPSLQEAAQAMGELKGDAKTNSLPPTQADLPLILPPQEVCLPLKEEQDLPAEPVPASGEQEVGGKGAGSLTPLSGLHSDDVQSPPECPPAPPSLGEEKPSLMELQERLNSRLFAAPTKIFIKANPQWGYVVAEGVVLVAGEVPSPEYLRSLLSNPITASMVRRLIEANPGWGFLIDREGQLWEF